MVDRAFLVKVSQQLIKDGKLLEAGWTALRVYGNLDHCTPQQLEEFRLVYLAGCQHLWASVISTVDEDSEPTEADMERMNQIGQEIESISPQLQLRFGFPKGRG